MHWTDNYSPRRHGGREDSRSAGAGGPAAQIPPWDHQALPSCILRALRAFVVRCSGHRRAAGRHHMLVEVLGEQREEMLAGVAAEDPVVPVRVLHELERLVGLDQPIDQGFAVLVMYVVVAGTVHEEEIGLEGV